MKSKDNILAFLWLLSSVCSGFVLGFVVSYFLIDLLKFVL